MAHIEGSQPILWIDLLLQRNDDNMVGLELLNLVFE